MWRVIARHSLNIFFERRSERYCTFELGFAQQCACSAVEPRSLSCWCVKYIARHLQFKSENTTNEVIFRVRERERHSQKIQSVPWITVLQISAGFWQTGGSQLFLDCLVGAVSRQKKQLLKELHLQFVQMAEEVRVNNNRGRKMLITEKHQGHDLTLLKVLFKLWKHQSVYQISSLPLSGPRGLPSTSFLQFSFPLSESTVDSWEWSRGSRRGLRVLCNSWCQARMLLRCLVELCRANNAG